VESKNNDLKVELLLQGVMPRSLPSLILIHNNKALTKRNGVITDEQLEDFLQEQLKDLQKENAPKSFKKEVVEKKQNTGFINFASEVDDYMLTDQ
jgi:hypothetical protein